MENNMSFDDQVYAINEILDKMRPYMNAEGGDLQYVDFKDGIVYIKVIGACADCGMIDLDISEGIEAMLIDSVPGVIGVEQVK
ncbi:MAG: NifU family protein [Acholeplasmatales bacterium]|jgi:Fe-S cluster biogenesis protein NfuA|nr:NifU family protein [Acholeplasmatales bacterium]